jgi:hypothetical protein
LASLAQLFESLGQFGLSAGTTERQPSVTILNHALEASATLGSQKDFGTTFLDGLGPGPDWIEVDEFAVKLGCILR